jgi:BASS family bile acid:Na+ symporter
MQAGAMVIVLNLCCMAMGYGLSKVARLNVEQTITITYEVGIQNLSLALTLANTILLMPDYAIFAIIYGFLMKFSALGFMAFTRRMRRQAEASQVASTDTV